MPGSAPFGEWKVWWNQPACAIEVNHSEARSRRALAASRGGEAGFRQWGAWRKEGLPTNSAEIRNRLFKGVGREVDAGRLDLIAGRALREKNFKGGHIEPV